MSIVVMAVSMVHVAGTLAADWLAPARPAPRLMPALGGGITELAIQFHRTRADLFLPVYAQLFAALDPEVAVRVVVGDAEDERQFELARAEWFPGGGGPSVRYAPVGRPITSWARDRLAVLPAPGGPTVLLAPPAPMLGPGARISDWTMPWTLADALGDGFVVRSAPFQFEGGDLIADADRVYVARPLLQRNPDVGADSVIASVRATVGRPVVALGTDGAAVPDHHIGMFLTPLGEGRVAVGDPALGLSLLPPGPLEVGGRQFVPETDLEMLQRFETVVTQLEAHDLVVVRLPLVPSTTPWAWMSYNNVLAEHRAGAPHVYLPTYGVPALDGAATEVWRAEGATVHPIDVSELFWHGGSVRCVTAPVSRRE